MALQRIARHASAFLPAILAISLVLATSGLAAAEVYVVQPGDTLYDIGLQYGIEPDELARYNGITDPSGLQVGQQLSIPEAGAGVTAAGGTYTVAPGDTLSGIAGQFGVAESDLAALNGLVDPSYLQVGQTLQIPGGSGQPSGAAGTTGPGVYVVAVGDTLSAIADFFGLSATAIAAANGLSDPNRLRVGQKLTIPERPQLSGRGGQRLAFVWPAFGEVTGYFHEAGPYWVSGYHEGLDIGASYGSVVRAAEEGLVVEAEGGWNRGYGTYVKIDHGNGLQTLYGHLSKLAVEPWEEVKRGQVIGYVGSTGASTGPHLHFEVRVNGEKKDPLQYLP